MKKLFKSLIVVIFLFITFFSIEIKGYTASFAYADFNWEEFLKQNKNYWIDSCDENDEDCIDEILKTKEKFYKRLYKLLATYEMKGFKIDDNIIIATVYYGLTPDSFKDGKTEYDEEQGYVIDESEHQDNFIASDDNNKQSAKDYFDKESDTLKTLMNAMIGYGRVCYGVSSPVNNVCSSSSAQLRDGKCIEKIKTIKANYFESIGFGDKADKECKELSKDYESYYLIDEGEKKVNEEFYWDFLINNKYFDNKFQLQHLYNNILRMTKHSKMSQLTSSEYKLYEKDIIEVRSYIVESIKNVLDTYGEFAVTPDSIGQEVSSTRYWWPIGGNVEEINGIKMAIGDPLTTRISSKFGGRINPTDNSKSEFHSGIDIPGSDGVTPVIATQGGTVVKSAMGDVGTCVNGDTNCSGSGYGNYIIIQHADGNYSLYAHLATNSVLVKSGDVVKQGQVVAFVGHTGRSTGPHLHFEIRVGENLYGATQDPLNFVNPDDPRATSTSSSMAEWIAILEGGKRKGDSYVVEDVGDHHKTFGPGITVEYNASQIRAHGIDPDSLDYGSLVPIKTGDAIFGDVLASHVDSVKKTLSSNNITVDEDQLTALVSLEYNCGNLKKFLIAYRQYGSSFALCENWWHDFALRDKYGKYYSGLAKRRKAECDLFVNKKYNMNPYG